MTPPPAVVHLLVGSMSACRKGQVGTNDRAAVTCRNCLARMEAGAERPLAPYLPSGRSPIRRAPRAAEPRETLEAAGLRIVLDAPPVPLKRGGYPE